MGGKVGVEELAEAVASVGMELPASAISAICQRLQNLPIGADKRAVLGVVSSPNARSLIETLIDTWADKSPETSSEAVSTALYAAALVDDSHRNRQTIEIVWSGPVPPGTTVRRTDQVLLDLIRNAKESNTIVTFASYDIPELRDAMKEALERGVQITLILESDKECGGKVTFDPLAAFGPNLAERAHVYCWPVENRERDGKGNYGSLHVKCAITDRKVILISSANITGHAMGLNMELGLLVRGGEVPQTIAEHFDELTTAGVLSKIQD